jgi:hypothetical protein
MSKIYQMPVSVSAKDADGNNVRQEIGKVPVTLFSLADFGIPSDILSVDAEGNYADPKMQWLQDAADAATKAVARNALVPKSLNCIPGRQIASTLTELITPVPAIRNGNGAKSTGLSATLSKEFAGVIYAYCLSVGKSTKAADNHARFIYKEGQAVLAYQPAKIREVLSATLSGFVEAASDEALAKYSTLVSHLADLCQGASVEEEGDM